MPNRTLLLASGPRAALTSQTMSGNALPTSQSQTAFGPASVNVNFDLGYDSMFTPDLAETVLHFDNDFAFDPTGFSECNSPRSPRYPRRLQGRSAQTRKWAMATSASTTAS